MPIAVYPGVFDPITFGHVDIASRAAAIFDHLFVAVYDLPTKAHLFPTEERLELATEALADLKNVETTSFSGLTIDFARQVGAKVIVRGIRGVSDFEVEMQMALINRKMAPDVESVYMMPSLDYSFVSATLIKEISKLGGPVSQLVPGHVASALRRKFRDNE